MEVTTAIAIMNKEKAGGRGVQMKVFTFRKRTTPETQPYIHNFWDENMGSFELV